jgi:hypothetical protein
MPEEGESTTEIPVARPAGDPGAFSAVGDLHGSARANPSLLRPEEMRAALRAHLRTLAKRYSPLGVAAVFLAVVLAFFPSTVAPIAHALTALPGPSHPSKAALGPKRTSKDAQNLARSTSPGQSGASSGSADDTPGSGYGSYGSSSQSSLGEGSGSGSGLLSGSTGTGSSDLGEGSTGTGGYGVGPSSPSAIEPASPSSSQATCPIPAPSLPGPQIAQVDSLLLVLEGVCSVLASSPGLLEKLPSTLEGLPKDFQSGTIPPFFETLAQELAFEVVIPLLSVLPLPSSLPGGASIPSIPGLSSIPGLPFFGSNDADPQSFASQQGVLSGSSYPLMVYRVLASKDAGSRSGSGNQYSRENRASQAQRPSGGLVIGLLQGEQVTKQLVKAIRAVNRSGGSTSVILVPRANDSGSLSGLNRWLTATERALPQGTQSFVSTQALVPILSGLLGYGNETLSPAESASALKAAGSGGKLAGLAVLGAMSPGWWKELAGSLSSPATANKPVLSSVLAALVPGSKGSCGSQGILETWLSQAGLFGVPVLSMASPGSGGPLAGKDALSCASQSIQDNAEGPGHDLEAVLQPLLGLTIPTDRI